MKQAKKNIAASVHRRLLNEAKKSGGFSRIIFIRQRETESMASIHPKDRAY